MKLMLMFLTVLLVGCGATLNPINQLQQLEPSVVNYQMAQGEPYDCIRPFFAIGGLENSTYAQSIQVPIGTWVSIGFDVRCEQWLDPWVLLVNAPPACGAGAGDLAVQCSAGNYPNGHRYVMESLRFDEASAVFISRTNGIDTNEVLWTFFKSEQ